MIDIEELIDQLRGFAEAYPEDIFRPLTDEEIKQNANIITRNSAAMGRHMSKFTSKAADAIEQLQLTIAKQASAAKMGMDAAKSSAQAMLTEAKKAQAESSPDVLASERAANAVLTAQIEGLERELEEAAQAKRNACRLLDSAIEQNERMKGELEEARRDAERLQWAIERDDNAEELYAAVLNNAGCQDAIRSSIDAAREKKG